MEGSLVIQSPPAAELVTLQEAKDWARITTSAEDSIVTGLISSARAHVEELMCRGFITQTWDYFLARFPCVTRANPLAEIALPRAPLASVTTVKYTDPATGTQVTLDPSKYLVDTRREPGRIVPAYGTSWPTARYGVPNAVEIRFVAGYGAAASNVPDRMRHNVQQAIKVLLATMYRYRELATEALTGQQLTQVPHAFWQLINQHRLWWI